MPGQWPVNSRCIDGDSCDAYNASAMPELPEVETVARGLDSALSGHAFSSVKVLWDRSLIPPEPKWFAARLQGRRIRAVGRRGKWLVMTLDGNGSLLVHLRMTGRLLLGSEACLDTRHLRVLFLMDNGQSLSFIDQRKFGRIALVGDTAQMLGTLGPEPLSAEFTISRFARMLACRSRAVKPLLLDQRFLAGLGNIYADEALWRAGIHPLRRSNELSLHDVSNLHAAIRHVLLSAIRFGGTTLPDAAYRTASGEEGNYGQHLVVYGREKLLCPRCGSRIERTRVAQRGTRWCPGCQQLPHEGA
jgi:formamidopyrimidine-DNA glycosylase